ncbi:MULTISPECIES: ATP-binding protein [unclassified Micromonospora]|uniref:sensor histidine kinase n=1 Tax=unclassified Micromonospora TaxID=2617518 RepID=UPI0033274991
MVIIGPRSTPDDEPALAPTGAHAMPGSAPPALAGHLRRCRGLACLVDEDDQQDERDDGGGGADVVVDLPAAQEFGVVGRKRARGPCLEPTAVDRAAYRIVQESLTNVARHAGPATALVCINYAPDTLTVRVDDDGKATPKTEPVPGVGLLGMRERVTALGGRLHAGPRPEGGFTVQATLPVDQAS